MAEHAPHPCADPRERLSLAPRRRCGNHAPKDPARCEPALPHEFREMDEVTLGLSLPALVHPFRSVSASQRKFAMACVSLRGLSVRTIASDSFLVRRWPSTRNF